MTSSFLAFMVMASLVVGVRVAARDAHVRVEPLVNFALPPSTTGCAGAQAVAGGAELIPITVSTVAGQVAAMVNVCIGGLGPYPFLLDSGAGESIIDAHLASKLHLAKDGPQTEFDGVGCTGNARPFTVASWSLGGVPLDTQPLLAATLPDFGRPGQAVGLLGSDVLSRFGAVRVDFTAQTLTLAGPEGRPLPAKTVHGSIGPHPSTVLTQGEAGITVPLTVDLSPGNISLNVRLRFGQGPTRDFVVDTGSSQSVVADSVARAARLSSTDLAQRQTTVCSTVTVPLVRSGRWSIPGVTLRSQLLGRFNFGSFNVGSTVGLLGSDQLKRFGWVIFDYRGGRLVLG